MLQGFYGTFLVLESLGKLQPALHNELNNFGTTANLIVDT